MIGERLRAGLSRFMKKWLVKEGKTFRSETDTEVLANLISFTPGTLTIAVDEERSDLFVHALHIGRPERVREQVERLERRLLWVVR